MTNPTEDAQADIPWLMAERISRLPRWAQEYIHTLRRDRAEAIQSEESAKLQVREENASSSIFVEAMNHSLDRTPIDKYSSVIFQTGPGRSDYVRARIEGADGLSWVSLSTSDGAIVTRGLASNVLYVRPNPEWHREKWAPKS